MNQVELKVLEVKLPEVFFNEQEILNYLDGELERFEGLVFTEDTAKDCKATVTELNKLVKSVEDFRKQYKKQLSEPIAMFESKCKLIVEKIEGVQEPLKLQAENFEIKRRENRRIEVESFIQEVLDIIKLEEKWSCRLVIRDEWLNSSLTNPKVKKAITEDADKLQAEQKSYYDKKEVIITKSELYSMKFGLIVPLIAENFFYLLENYDGPEIDEKIYKIAEKTSLAEKEAIEKIEAEAKAKAERESAIEIEKVKQESQEQVQAALEVVAEITQSVEKFIPTERTEIEKTYKATFEVRGSKSQLESLVEYMTASNIQFVKK